MFCQTAVEVMAWQHNHISDETTGWNHSPLSYAQKNVNYGSKGVLVMWKCDKHTNLFQISNECDSVATL